MNAGQYLVSKSPLNSGTALAHLLAITQGGGAGRTVFASQMTVCIKSRTTASSPARAQQPTTMAQRAALSVVVPRENRVSVRANNPRALYVTENAHDSITVLLPANAAFVLQKPSPDVVVTTRAKTTAATGGV